MLNKDISSLLRPGMGMRVVERNSMDHEYWNGRLLVWEPPSNSESYVLGVDPAEGVGADNSVCQVIKLATLTHPAEQVAEYACNWKDPEEFAKVINTIGRFYHDSDGTEAFCTLEINAPCGPAMITTLRMQLDYNNLFIWKKYDRVTNMYTNTFGWWTNRTTRPMIIARGQHAFIYGDLIVRSPFLLKEMTDFKSDGFMAKAAARSGTHDDRLMALLIGYWGGNDEAWMAGDNVDEERRLRGAAKEEQDELREAQAPQMGKSDYQNQAMSVKRASELGNQLLESWLDDN